ncbi:MAG: hypothetical protein AABY64_14105 [Bdellovibrionota bacterium]|mgnify:FL=1
MKKMLLFMIGVFLLIRGADANAKTVKATEMGSTVWSDISDGSLKDVIVEFRQGDEIPLSFKAEGDLVESSQESVSYIRIKRNFWLRLNQSTVELSLNGVKFKKLNEALTGSLEAGANANQSGGPANTFNIIFKAFLK